MLGVPPDDWLQETRPLADIHPYGAYLLVQHWQPADHQKFVAAALKIKPLGIELPGTWLGFELQSFHQAKGEEFMNEAFRNCDETAFELTQKITWTDHDDSLDGRAWRLLAVSPHSPISQARLISRKFDEVSDHADAWELAAERHPRLALGFAKHYADQNPDRAERLCYAGDGDFARKRSLFAVGRRLRKQGKEAAWLATLEDFLKQPAFGLEHAQIQVQIADHFIREGKWTEAKPYAEGAAESYPAWGLYKAAGVDEALANVRGRKVLPSGRRALSRRELVLVQLLQTNRAWQRSGRGTTWPGGFSSRRMPGLGARHVPSTGQATGEGAGRCSNKPPPQIGTRTI